MRGSIVKRGKKYSIVVDVGRDIETNKRKQQWFSGYNKKTEAEKDLPRILRELELGTFVAPSKVKFNESVMEWITLHTKKKELQATTLDGYMNIINNHLIPFYKDIEVQKILPMHIQQYFNKKLEELQAKTLEQHYRVIKQYFDYLKKLQIISNNPCLDIDKPKAKKKKTEVLKPEDVKRLIELVSENYYYEAAVPLALVLGLRRGEVLGLRWSDIDFENNTIHIEHTQQKVKGEYIYKDPKNESSNRIVVVPGPLIEILKKHKKLQAKLKLASTEWNNDKNLVCTRFNGGPITPTVMSTSFKNFMIKHGLPAIRFHDLRHTNASLMHLAKISFKEAANRLGHSNTKITADLYTHLYQNMDYEAAEKLSDVIYK